MNEEVGCFGAEGDFGLRLHRFFRALGFADGGCFDADSGGSAAPSAASFWLEFFSMADFQRGV